MANGLVAEARGRVYAALARGYLYPGAELMAGLHAGDLVAELADALAVLPAAGVLGGEVQELRAALAADLAVAPGSGPWQREHVRLFGQGHGMQALPYETEYTCAHLWQQQQAMADIAGFYRAFGVEVPAGGDRPDAIATELYFMYLLCTKESLALAAADGAAAELCREAQAKFLAGHLGTWTGVLAILCARSGASRFSAALIRCTDAWVADEAARAGVQPVKTTRLLPLAADGLAPAAPKGV